MAKLCTISTINPSIRPVYAVLYSETTSDVVNLQHCKKSLFTHTNSMRELNGISDYKHPHLHLHLTTNCIGVMQQDKVKANRLLTSYEIPLNLKINTFVLSACLCHNDYTVALSE